uniref:DNA-directed RNA polymerase subunit alpha n=1 Tax=Gracilaria edulis TaxID=172966 RepID=A0A6C0A9K1_9FLOR|nr:RNA polymerase alpha subunit [Gracilaria edulis]QHS70488.1 RNA polymerase alpha subunit [Gracilaria edulis]UAD85654.1 RNA polymerase subunit alpha [Gracilaria edulis]
MNNLQIECIESKIQSNRHQYGRFILQPLNKGQGITLGNSLRRTILSDLEGAAIVAVRIAGINHEFSTITGVKEDVLEILLNLKEVVLKSYTDIPQIGRIRIQGPAIITTGLFDLPPEIQIIDPQQYIATICNNTIFEMEFRIEKGRGYRLTDKGFDNKSIDFLHIDAVFMPAIKFNYVVEEKRINPKIVQEQLDLEIWTNGSLSPQEAISQGAQLLTKLFYPLTNLNLNYIKNTDKKDEEEINEILIEELQLSVRAYNCLKRAQIHSISDLLDYSHDELLEIKNFGQKSAEEVIEALENKLGIKLPKEKNIENN